MKAIKPLRCTLITCLAAYWIISSQTQRGSVNIAPWKNDVTAAYSIISDDFGIRSWGNYMDFYRETHSRGIKMSFAMIPAHSDPLPNMWVLARQLVADGHEIVSHGWNHDGIGDLPIPQYSLHVDRTSAIINANVPTQKILFMAFPFDNWGQHNGNYLLPYVKTKMFIGTRTGSWIVDGINNPTFDPFALNHQVYEEGDGVAELNITINGALSIGGFGLREMHSVHNPLRGSIPLNVFIQHLDYCKTLMDAGKLWVAPVTQVIKYAMERDNFRVNIILETTSEMRIKFITNAVEINSSPMVSNSDYNEPLTLNVTIPYNFSGVVVRQNSNAISYKITGPQKIMFNANPWEGVVIITTKES